MADRPLLSDRNPLPEAVTGDLRRQLQFILEADQLKTILRQTRTPAGDRPENDAEHSWHLTLMALVLSGHAGQPVDVGRVLTMLVVHDLVEIYAGDTPLHEADAGQEEREREAADQLFPLLPPEQAEALRGAWEEFEAHESAEARFARSLDRLQPLLLEWQNEGRAWQALARDADAVRGTLGIIDDGSPTLWDAAQTIIAEAARRDYLLGE